MTDNINQEMTCYKHGKQDVDDYYVYNRGYRKRYMCKKCVNYRNKKNRETHREDYKEYWKLYSYINSDKINEKYHNLRLMILKHYSEELCCEICNENNLEFLALDHKFGGGNKHRKEIGTGGKRIYNWIIKNNFPSEFRVLCHNCNFKYRNNKLCGVVKIGCELKTTNAHRDSNRRSRQKLKTEVMEYYGGKCECCEVDNLDILSIDHINGGGTKYIKELGGGGVRLYKWLRDNGYPTGYRVLCMNCNKSRGSYGYCPHKKEIIC